MAFVDGRDDALLLDAEERAADFWLGRKRVLMDVRVLKRILDQPLGAETAEDAPSPPAATPTVSISPPAAASSPVPPTLSDAALARQLQEASLRTEVDEYICGLAGGVEWGDTLAEIERCRDMRARVTEFVDHGSGAAVAELVARLDAIGTALCVRVARVLPELSAPDADGQAGGSDTRAGGGSRGRGVIVQGRRRRVAADFVARPRAACALARALATASDGIDGTPARVDTSLDLHHFLGRVYHLLDPLRLRCHGFSASFAGGIVGLLPRRLRSQHGTLCTALVQGGWLGDLVCVVDRCIELIDSAWCIGGRMWCAAVDAGQLTWFDVCSGLFSGPLCWTALTAAPQGPAHPEIQRLSSRLTCAGRRRLVGMGRSRAAEGIWVLGEVCWVEAIDAAGVRFWFSSSREGLSRLGTGDRLAAWGAILDAAADPQRRFAVRRGCAQGGDTARPTPPMGEG